MPIYRCYMPEYKEGEFFVIYSRVIRENEALPFDCFVLLTLSNKVAMFIPAGSVVTPSKIQRLQQFSKEKLLIRIEAKNLYYDYLKKYAEQPENLELIKKDMETNPDTDLGLPKDLMANLGKVKVDEPVDSTIGAVLEVLKNQTEELHKKVITTNSNQNEEITKINDVTLKIEEELIKVTGDVGSDDFKQTIKNITEHLNDEIVRVGAITHTDENKKTQHHQMIQDMRKEIEDLSQSNDPADLETRKQRVHSKLQIIRSLNDNSQENLITEAIQSIIGNVEQVLGVPLNLKLLRQQDSQNTIKPADITNEVLKGSGKADPEILHRLKNLVSSQENIIKELTEKMKSSVELFGDLKTRWFTFQMTTKRKIDPSDQMKSKSITQQFYDFESAHFKGLNEDRKSLKKSTHHFYYVITGDPKSGEQIENLTDDPDENSIFNGLTSQVPDGQEEGEEGAQGSNSSVVDVDTVMAENNVLKVQLENAQALVDTVSKKTSELEEMLRGGGEYTQSLEEDLAQTKKKLEEVLNDSQDFEADRRRLSEGLEEMSTALYRQKTDQTCEVEKHNQLQIRVIELEKTLKIYSDKVGSDVRELSEDDAKALPQEVQKALLDKDGKIKTLTKQLDIKNDDLTQTKKDLESLRSEDRKFELEKKDLAKRIEKQRVEFETLKQKQKTIELKNVASANLLLQARKTINKLTDENGELRTDRTKYIRKTNEALAEHKSLVSQALNLNSQIQVEIEKNRQLENQIQTQKDREVGLAKKIHELSTHLNQIESEKKKIETEMRKQSKNDKQSEIDQLRQLVSDLEKKIERAKSDYKIQQDQLIQEQKKNHALEQSLKKKAA